MNFFMNLFDLNSFLNIYNGLASIFIAFIVFTVETIRDYNDTLKKKVLLNNIRIDFIIGFSLFLLLLFYLYSGLKEYFYYRIVFGTICSIAIISYGVLLFKTYKTITQFNNDSEFYLKKRREYIERISFFVEEKSRISDENILTNASNQFDEYVKSNTIFCKVKPNLNEYSEIKSLRSGIVWNISYERISNIIKLVENIQDERKIENIIYLNFKIGDEISKNKTIIYCKKEYLKYFKNINELIIYYDFIIKPGKEYEKNNSMIKEIVYGLIKDEMNINPNKVDSYIFDYYKFLYENKLYNIIKQTKYCFNDYYLNIEVNENAYKKYIRILNHVKFWASFYKDIDLYKEINNLIISINKTLLYIATDKKQVAFDFINSYKIYIFNSKDEYMFYEEEKNNLLLFVIELLSNKYYDALDVIINNAKYLNENNKTIDIRSIIDFQFVIGIITAITTIYYENKCENHNIVKKLLNLIKNKYTFLFSLNDIIEMIDYSFYFDSLIKKTYFNIEIFIVDHKYKNSFSGYANDIISTFFNMITLLNINYCSLNQITKNSPIDIINETINLLNNRISNINKYVYERVGIEYNLKELLSNLKKIKK